jgi:hypothetical protein
MAGHCFNQTGRQEDKKMAGHCFIQTGRQEDKKMAGHCFKQTGRQEDKKMTGHCVKKTGRQEDTKTLAFTKQIATFMVKKNRAYSAIQIPKHCQLPFKVRLRLISTAFL